ncbi:DNA-directed RNA polymerase subunit alpha C-terminal domain-containing protein [Paenibacillus sp. DR312]|uniref:DNA-directed RNA polymerase subunit alpha C-terminal domain-containing protein n=1 Tax=Paenibacillus sp. DR312 TaxID=2871175 RepID=UPI0037C5D400
MERSLECLIKKKVETRTYNCLLRTRLTTVDEILKLNYEELSRVRNWEIYQSEDCMRY